MVNKSVAFSAFLLILFVLAISEISSVRGELCEKASKTWSGNCGNTGHCDDQYTCDGQVPTVQIIGSRAALGACHVLWRKGKDNTCASASSIVRKHKSFAQSIA
ncbi:anther-specific protein SF18-like protein [Tanacetum coccineum]